jgi:hypothetical protein
VPGIARDAHRIMNVLGRGPVPLHVFLAAGFGYFAFIKR